MNEIYPRWVAAHGLLITTPYAAAYPKHLAGR